MKVLNAIAIIAFMFIVLSGCSKSNPSASKPSFPVAAIADVTQDRSIANSNFQFTVTLSKSYSQNVTIQYTTADGTAVQGKDYTTASGTLTIASGSLSGTVTVQVIGDSLRQVDQDFFVELSNPQNCSLNNTKATGTIVNANLLYFPVDNTGYSTPASYPGYTLAWSDEFGGNSISTANWAFESGNNSGWGNNELEYYTNSTNNAFVSNGNLIIEARQENQGGFYYTSARMKTEGLQSFQYGRVDIRAKLPAGKGIWPALWLLGNNINTVGWPTCGEIDLMEELGQQPNTVYGTLHWGASAATQQSKGTSYALPSGSFDQQFHVYTLLWAQDSLSMLIDDQPFFTSTGQDIGSNNPFNNSFFFIFNIAVGGNWPGAPDETTLFPQRMAVDYIRVFQK